ncbi:MAG: transcriptional regulator, GntR family with aminotransferase domain [Verrucomicrobiaceae bacterium]|nr:transcriptional regulator, GntR family with aminotransferase domain [Verrucomicrobiaceae bacterium]
MPNLYNRVARDITRDIERDIYRPGERLPGVRRLAQQYQVSIATALEACRLLEDQGRLEARLRSGFFVRLPIAEKVEEPAMSSPPKRPSLVKGQELALQLVKAANDPKLISFGAAVPTAQFLPLRAVNLAMGRALREHGTRAGQYEFPPGDINLRRQIARRMTEIGSPVDPEELIITNGCQEALGLALRAITQPGDVVAVESPAYYGLFQVIDFLGLKALEIPTHPREGISIEALEFALEQWPVKAVIAMPNFSNPLGGRMSDERKKALVKLLARKQIILIEDDIYGDLGFHGERPSVARGFDPNGETVIHCSSFTKTLAPGLRVGWIAPGRFQERIEYLKYVLNLATPTAPQLAIADLLERGGYDRYLRQARNEYEQAVTRMTRAVEKYFPEGTRVTQPDGGFVLWVEFPTGVDSEILYDKALAHGICIAPGPMFSATRKYRNFIRLNCAVPWEPRVEKALIKLGQLAGS